MKMRDRIEKQAKDMVDMALQWMILSKELTITEDGKKEYELFDAMQLEVLKTYTDIEDKINATDR